MTIDLRSRLEALQLSETVSLERVAALVERLEQGQTPSTETQAAAWVEVLNALSIALHATRHSVKGSEDCGNERCWINDEVVE
jgi:hypothetical protein